MVEKLTSRHILVTDMDQHPVPQNISGYEFRLIGDMTLKQFLQLAGGVGMALLFYNSPLPFFIKWPFIFICVLTGILLAFIPVGGRPFSQWFIAFIKAVYSPTQYIWTSSSSIVSTKYEEVTKKDKTPLDILEDQLISRFNQIINKPDLEINIKAKPINLDSSNIQSPPPSPKINIELPKIDEKEVLQQTQYSVANQIFPIKDNAEQNKVKNVTMETKPIEAYKKQEMVENSEIPKISTFGPSIVYQPISSTPSNQTATNMPIPNSPNIIVGQVVTTSGEPVDGAIVEVVDNMTNIPVRALRTNKIGQFQMATPLFSGVYTIITDKEGIKFEPISVKVEDSIVSPVLIRASS